MMEDSVKSEDVEPNNVVPGSSQVGQTFFDTRPLVDNKNTQVRVVRGTKKLKLDNSDPPNSEKKDVKDEEATEAKVRPLKRSCELWSMEDKNTFFKALNEYGKDFDALQSYFLSQGKKRGLSDAVIKNKEQIRHFYYRTWLKISKHLKFSEDVKKTAQELYGLINYGELRRKLPRIHEKVHLRLNELVYWGSTQVRLRGKTMRIKTPICRALRKLNQLEDWQEEIKLPSRITIELRPRNNMAWWQVQAASMNPRVRTLLPIQRRLSSLLVFLQQRWRLTKYATCTTVENLIANDVKDTRLLRVAPSEGCKIALPMVNLGEYLTSNSLSLNSYEKRLGLKSSRIDLLGSVQHLKGIGKKGIKRYKLDKKILSRTDENCALPDTSSDMDLLETGSSVSEKQAIINNTEKPSPEQHSESRFPGRETVDRIRKGWNVEEANTITMGDLFLMFGRESKITLEYWWDWLPSEQRTSDSASSSIMRDDSLCLALQKLLSLAKHNYGTNKVYDNTSGSNETVISSRVPSIKESVKESTFRRPLIPQAYHKSGTADAFKTQLDKFKTRFCKRGRTVRQKSLVIQRVLPIVSSSPNMSSESLTSDHTSKIDDSSLCQTDKMVAVNAVTQDKNFLDALETSGDAKNSNSIITSATQILKEGEHQWLNSEVADFSLSSFLGQLESPIKSSQRSQAGEQIMEDARPSSDVVSHMQCLMGENSVDYMAKFANLASQIASDENKK
ncbi:PREDICTED: protein cramped [Dinoponera quadriceps]|uniref:Protein cramped n=1 Tax=Dinoponera quadriceps TaxID=609295 RepID=A0A6P3XID4_DINQU|nr:PREDICTED: protein cramped [Dinoponera quadriceps]XP_014477730.1 PREDICTED: protein cramped [Dinoponera quadriceps]XP_014477731.1 PREDICTED: protein cramped [Dinoponera quadriceps]